MAHIAALLKGTTDPHSSEFSDRLRLFSVARALVFCITSGLIIAVLIQQGALSPSGYSVRFTLSVLLVAFVSAAVQWWASRRRFRLDGVALSLLVLDQGLFGGLAFITGGVSSGATSLYGVTCLVGGLLLGVPGAITAALSGLVSFVLLVIATQGEGAYRPPDQAAALYSLSTEQSAYFYVFNLLVLLLVGLLASYLAERLQSAGSEISAAHRRADQAERMAALGRLAAGLAHEIRNPLGSISGSVQMLKTGVANDEDRDLCDIVLRESERLNDLVSDMLDLSHSRQPARVMTDVVSIVNDVVELARKSGRGGIDVQITRSGLSKAVVHADPAQLRQLIWNLVRNAIQSSFSGGEVRVVLEFGESLILRVEDDGRGLDDEAKSRLFDAFFTTRSQGTGLGLAVVKRIADEHGFDISAEGDEGEGARFILDFGTSATENSRG